MKLKKTIQKIQKTIKCIFTLFNQIYKCMKTTKNKIHKIWLMIFAVFCLISCGVTKATISKPAQGTQTTITITTNNPITTNVDPSVELKKGE